ncbi:MAG: DUF6152 family protein [Steroidobacteraceae bacterium]
MKAATLTLASLAAAGVALAHHSTAQYDHEHKVLVEGTVERFKWTNPHSWMFVKVPDGKGGEEEWALEAGTPVQLMNIGWTKEKIKPGDKVKVVAVIARDGTKRGEIQSVITAAGETLKNKIAY